MEVQDILKEKREALICVGNPLAVEFSLDEINVLADVNVLRGLKLVLPFPENFEKSADLFECAKRIIDGDGDYRVLEFCVLKNKVLQMPVKQVFSKVLR